MLCVGFVDEIRVYIGTGCDIKRVRSFIERILDHISMLYCLWFYQLTTRSA